MLDEVEPVFTQVVDLVSAFIGLVYGVICFIRQGFRLCVECLFSAANKVSKLLLRSCEERGLVEVSPETRGYI